MWRSVIVLLGVSCWLGVVSGISFDLGPGKAECFYEEVHAKTMISGVFAVTEGSHMDIDVICTDPQNKVVYEVFREGEGRFSFRAELDGSYKFCFSNKVSVVSHKTVTIKITTGDQLDVGKLAKKEHMDNVQRWITSLTETVRMVDYHQQEYRVLHERHLNTVIKTNRRVKWWSLLECLAVCIASVLQIVIIKRMFRKPYGKRMV